MDSSRARGRAFRIGQTTAAPSRLAVIHKMKPATISGQTFLRDRVRPLVGDITHQTVDAIVNAANATLLGGGGVDGAIHRVGGPAILEECREIRRKQYPQGLPAGEAVITTAGKLPARFVVHTVGPIYGRHDGREAELLAACYTNSMGLAVKNSLHSIAFPAISTGVYGYPLAEAAATASQAIMDFLATDNLLSEVRLVFFKQSDLNVFLRHHKFVKN
jgi:O-acetyl-ADP-ribose deacetylase (regulator of RNase III)